MDSVLIEELIKFKILPFSIYSEQGTLLMESGDILTPGKLLQLKHAGKLLKVSDEIETEKNVFTQEKIQSQKTETKKENSKTEEVINESPYQIVEKFDLKPVKKVKKYSPIDNIDISGYKGPTNKTAVIETTTQIKIKAFYSMILDKIANKEKPSDIVELFQILKDKIILEINNHIDSLKYNSELKFIGEYKRCHAINTAILSALLAIKMGEKEEKVADITLSALLHDIGKLYLPPEIKHKADLDKTETTLLNAHTTIGYNIIVNEYKLPKHIARAALEHHENYDGTGYPKGISGDLISSVSEIICVCNFFDNLTFNKTAYKIKNSREALKIMLEAYSKNFSPEILFSFIYMLNYCDKTNFEDMVL